MAVIIESVWRSIPTRAKDWVMSLSGPGRATTRVLVNDPVPRVEVHHRVPMMPVPISGGCVRAGIGPTLHSHARNRIVQDEGSPPESRAIRPDAVPAD